MPGRSQAKPRGWFMMNSTCRRVLTFTASCVKGGGTARGERSLLAGGGCDVLVIVCIIHTMEEHPHGQEVSPLGPRLQLAQVDFRQEGRRRSAINNVTR